MKSPNPRAQSMFFFCPTHNMRGTAINQPSQDAQRTMRAANDMNRSITRTGRPTDTCQSVSPPFPHQRWGQLTATSWRGPEAFLLSGSLSGQSRMDKIGVSHFHIPKIHTGAWQAGRIHTFIDTWEQKSWVKMTGQVLICVTCTLGSSVKLVSYTQMCTHETDREWAEVLHKLADWAEQSLCGSAYQHCHWLPPSSSIHSHWIQSVATRSAREAHCRECQPNPPTTGFYWEPLSSPINTVWSERLVSGPIQSSGSY